MYGRREYAHTISFTANQFIWYAINWCPFSFIIKMINHIYFDSVQLIGVGNRWRSFQFAGQRRNANRWGPRNPLTSCLRSITTIRNYWPINTTLRVWDCSYTRDVRQYDADTATIGSVADYRLLIPPKQEAVTISRSLPSELFQT